MAISRAECDAFIEAARNGEVETVEEHLSQAENLGDFLPPNDYRVKAMHRAAENRAVEVVKCFLRKCATILEHEGGSSDSGCTLMHIACATGQEDIVSLLHQGHQHQVNVNAKADGAITPLHLAAFQGHLRLVELLCQWDSLNLDAQTSTGVRALHVAAYAGKADIVDSLLDRLVTPFGNAEDAWGFTPLHYATFHGHVPAVERLIANSSIDVKAVDRHRMVMAVHLAALASADNSEVMQVLLNHPDVDVNAKMGAVVTVSGAPPVVLEKLISSVRGNQAPVNICWFPKLPHPDLCDVIAHVNFISWKEDKGGASPLHLASKSNKPAVVGVLLEDNETEVNAIDFYGMTPLHYAAVGGHVDVVKLLLSDSRVNLNVSTNVQGRYREETPLHLAVRKGRTMVIKELCSPTRPDLQATSENREGRIALALVWEKRGQSWESIRQMLLGKQDVKTYMDILSMERQVLQQAASALLVAGTMILTLIFPLLRNNDDLGQGQSAPPPNARNDLIDCKRYEVLYSVPISRTPAMYVLLCRRAVQDPDTPYLFYDMNMVFGCAFMGIVLLLGGLLPTSTKPRGVFIAGTVKRLQMTVYGGSICIAVSLFGLVLLHPWGWLLILAFICLFSIVILLSFWLSSFMASTFYWPALFIRELVGEKMHYSLSYGRSRMCKKVFTLGFYFFLGMSIFVALVALYLSH